MYILLFRNGLPTIPLLHQAQSWNERQYQTRKSGTHMKSGNSTQQVSLQYVSLWRHIYSIVLSFSVHYLSSTGICCFGISLRVPLSCLYSIFCPFYILHILFLLSHLIYFRLQNQLSSVSDIFITKCCRKSKPWIKFIKYFTKLFELKHFT